MDKQWEQKLFDIYKSSYNEEVSDELWPELTASISNQNYVVQKGDTLWEISEVFFGDGFYWSKLWSLNGEYTNPHVLEVGDRVTFTVGSAQQAPSYLINKSQTRQQSISELQEELLNDEGSVDLAYSTPSQPIPESFKAEEMSSIEELFSEPLVIEKRPEADMSYLRSLKTVMLTTVPEDVGEVVTVGRGRIIGAKRQELVVREAQRGELLVAAKRRKPVFSKDSLPEESFGAELYSVVAPSVDRVSSGNLLDIKAIIRADRSSVDKHVIFKVVEQFDGVKAGDRLLRFVPPRYNLDMNQKPIRSDARYLKTSRRTLYGNGDIIYLKEKDDIMSVGQLVLVDEKFDRDYDDFTFVSGLLKIVYKSGPYLTAVLLDNEYDLEPTY